MMLLKIKKYWQKVVGFANKLKSFLGKSKLVLLYHHRVCEDSDLELLLRHLSELKKYYSTKEYECQIVLYKQIIIPEESKKHLKYIKSMDIHIFDFYTHHTWTGHNQREYWALIDDSLISKMLDKVKSF